MAASFTIAGRNNGYSDADTRAATLASVTAYREAMAGSAQMRMLDIWYANQKAHTRDSLQALSKLGELVDGRYRIVSQPPVVIPARDLAATFGVSPT